MKRVYIDFEMNMPNSKSKRAVFNSDIIAIGAVMYDEKTKNIDKFKSLIRPVSNEELYPHIQELTHISSEELKSAPSYEEVMRKFKKWLGIFSDIKGIYTFGNLDLTCFNNTDMRSAKKNNHPRFVNNIRDLFVDIKEKYINCGMRCMNYISLKNLLEFVNLEFSGDAHDPLNDAYNLFILDEAITNNVDIQNLLIIRDIIRPPFNDINSNLDNCFNKFKESLYKKEGNYNIVDFSVEIIKTVRMYLLTIIDVNIQNLEIMKDISKKMDTIDKLKDIEEGYFYLLEDVYFDMKDVLEDLMLYRMNEYEYKYEIKNIIKMFDEDLDNEKIYINKCNNLNVVNKK
ncbi:exonuclease domain-containing protein [Clostridioides difficile]|uniref:3'-5' exonuclease n=1 Tax=Clostridioides difficile TaxID=1496 RepID=UPI00107E7CA7|nr:exonuclease domain-containing protein [Clostridioides difficile]